MTKCDSNREDEAENSKLDCNESTRNRLTDTLQEDNTEDQTMLEKSKPLPQSNAFDSDAVGFGSPLFGSSSESAAVVMLVCAAAIGFSTAA